MNKRNLICLILLISFSNCFCQEKSQDRNVSKSISKKKFDNLVDSSIKLLKTKLITNISDSENIQIIMCLNTILSAHYKTEKRFGEKKFQDGRYKELTDLESSKKYGQILATKIYKDWVPNRGMGFYYKKIKMELYGTPMPYSYYYVIE